ncbi:MAG: MFS transporter [Armatimonadota bacterium]
MDNQVLKLFKNKNFFLLWAGQVVSQIGDRIHTIAFLWFLYNYTGSALDTGIGLICVSLPAVLLSPIAGSFIDRYDRRKIMIIADIGRFIVIGFVAYLAYQETLTPIWLYVTTVIASIFNTFFNPALLSSIPNFVEDKELAPANSLMQVSTTLSGFLGFFLGGVLIAVSGVPFAFTINAGSFLVSTVFLVLLSIPKHTVRTKEKNLFKDIKEGIKYLCVNSVFGKMLLFFGVVNFFTASILVLLPVFTKTVLKAEAGAFGILNSMVYAGMFAATLYAAVFSEIKKKALLVSLTIFVMGLGYIFLAFAGNLIQGSISLFVFGSSLGLLNIYLIVMFQRAVPDDIRGRVFSIINSLVFSMQPIAYGFIGAAADFVSVQNIFIISGASIILCSFLIYRIKGFSDL